MGRAIDVDPIHLPRLRLAAMTRRDVLEYFVDEALLDREIVEPCGQRHPYDSAKQHLDPLRPAVIPIPRPQQQHAMMLVIQHEPEQPVESRG